MLDFGGQYVGVVVVGWSVWLLWVGCGCCCCGDWPVGKTTNILTTKSNTKYSYAIKLVPPAPRPIRPIHNLIPEINSTAAVEKRFWSDFYFLIVFFSLGVNGSVLKFNLDTKVSSFLGIIFTLPRSPPLSIIFSSVC